MTKYIFLGALLLSLTACQKSEEPGAATVAPEPATAVKDTSPAVAMEEPMPEKRPYELTLHGVTRVDDYFRLRDDERSDPEVLA